MKTSITTAVVLALTLAGLAAGSQAQGTGARMPVIVELFTSEGCSSCPPADALLAKLLADQPVSGAQVIALAHHVDYWDKLGWPDPFADRVFTDRQAQYRRRLRLDQLFTPQMIVDGRDSFVGSDGSAARKAIGKAARAAKAAVELSIADPGRLHVGARIAGLQRAGHRQIADLVLAVTEDGLTSNVERGENRGRRLAHAAVVRLIAPVMEIAPGADGVDADVPVLLESTWDRERLNVVAFVQERESGRVLGAATAPLR